MEIEKIRITQQEKEELLQKKEEIERRQQVVAEELEHARGEGDLSENADYQTKKDEQAKLDTELSLIRDKIKNSIVIDVVEDGTVSIGKKVVYEELDTGDKVTVIISGLSKLDLDEDVITILDSSKVGTALVGHQVGDICEVLVDNPYKIKILDIKVLEK